MWTGISNKGQNATSKVVALIVILVLAYFAYQWYQSSKPSSEPYEEDNLSCRTTTSLRLLKLHEPSVVDSRRDP